MGNTVKGLFAALFIFVAGISSAHSQTCNDPSGFLKSLGPISLGNLLILGPDCQHVQDGGAPQGTSININSILSYGGNGNGTFNNSAAIASALAGTPCGGQLVFPAGIFLYTPPIVITCPINIIGAGSSVNGGTGTVFLAAAGTPTTIDCFDIIGQTNVATRGYTFQNFSGASQSGNVCRNFFHFDSTAGTTTGFAEVVISNIYAPASVSAGGYSINVDNGTGVNANGGTFNFTASGNFLAGGINFQKAGDSLRVLNNIITGANTGITINQVSGAAGFEERGNNITSTAGCIVDVVSIKAILDSGECEQSTSSTETNNSVIDIQSGASDTSLQNKTIQNVSSVLSTLPIRNAGSNTTIMNNRISALGSASYITNISGSSNTIIYPNFYAGFSSGPNITDAGTNTIYLPNSKGTPLGVLGNPSSVATAAPYSDIVPSNVDQILRADTSGSSIGFGSINLAGSGAVGSTILKVVNGGTGDSGTSWTTYTPTITFTGGTGNSGGSPVGGYKQLGKTLHVRVSTTITYTTIPTSVAFNLPLSLLGVAAQTQFLWCYDNFNGIASGGLVAGGSNSVSTTGLITASGQPLNCEGVLETQ